MAFNFNVFVGNELHIAKVGFDDVELICEVERDFPCESILALSIGVYTHTKFERELPLAVKVFAEQTNSDQKDVVDQLFKLEHILSEFPQSEHSSLLVSELIDQLDSMLELVQKNSDTLLTNFLVKIYNPKSKRYRRFKSKTEWHYEEWNHDKTGFTAITSIHYGKRVCHLLRTVFTGEDQYSMRYEMTDLRSHSEYTLPNGSPIIIEKSPREDTLSPHLIKLRDWLKRQDQSTTAVVIAGSLRK